MALLHAVRETSSTRVPITGLIANAVRIAYGQSQTVTQPPTPPEPQKQGITRMKITVTRGELKDAASGFAKIITGKPSLAVLGCIRFAIENGGLTAQATDLDQTGVYRFNVAEAEGKGVIIIPFQLLKDLSKGDGVGRITLENEGTDITVTNNVGGHAITRTVAGIDDAEWPAAGAAITTSEAKGFLQAYRRMAPFASVDETRRTLCAVYVDVSGEGERNATLVACDGRRLTCCNSMKLPVDDENGVIVPVTKFLLWNGLPDEVNLGVSKSKECPRIGISAGQWTYRVKAVEGVYPNWRQVLPVKDGMDHRMTFTDSDVEALRKILPNFPGKEAVFLDGATSGTLSISGSDAGNSKELTVPLTAGSSYKGTGCRFIVNRAYLLDALNAGFRNFMFADVRSPMLSEDGKGAAHVLMPLRFGSEPPKPAQVSPEPDARETAPASQASTAEATTTKPEQAQVPDPATPKEKKEMTTETKNNAQPAQELTALEKLQAAYDTAKNKVREAQSALSDVAVAIRDAVKEDRQRRVEIDNVRAGLQKLQSIKV
jgi:DNA polymerase III sliding clamp (beta) subunit (PCNA family)